MGNLNIVVGNIVDDKILEGHDLIINATNPYMIAGGGIAGLCDGLYASGSCRGEPPGIYSPYPEGSAEVAEALSDSRRLER